MVVSPLIALMADQWRRLREAGVNATMLASGMEEGHNAQALAEIAAGETQLVLAAPERFASRAFREALAQRKIALFVVDEAHCVAEWGHDFRPDYLRLHSAIEALGRPPVMAATATATPRVAEEIAARLGLREWLSIRSGFDRPSLAFDVVSVEGKGAVARKRAALLHVLGAPSALPAIVYCGTRKDTDEVAALIAERTGIETVRYHAGMSPDARRASQEAFMEGQRRGGGGDERVWYGRRQGGCADGRPLGAADEPRGLLPGGWPRWTGWPPGAGAAARGEDGSGPADQVHQRA